ncbi:MAG TPA: hypothetical protein DCQ90_04965 [Erysipelotrichaceae bacterium]|nr:hypothetical protein [Erysipelotrichaceae bacterium]
MEMIQHENMGKRCIYIMLSDTGTLLTRAIRVYTHQQYNHISMVLDGDFDQIYSFGRVKANNPFIGGFINESETKIFDVFDETTCTILKLDVDDLTYDNITESIRTFKEDRDLYRYNLIGYIGFIINHPIKRQNAYFCSQFVSETLERNGVKLFNKPPELVLPSDFLECDAMTRIYSGKFSQFAEIV